MNVLRNKKVLAVLAVLVVLLAVAFITVSNRESEQQTDEPTLSESDKKFYADKDKKKDQSLKDMLSSITLTYKLKGLEFPLSDKDGWLEVLDTVPITDAFFDPYTDHIYQFAKGENPEYGEIQYGPGMACDEKSSSKTFKKGYGLTSLALRAKFSDGYRCVNNYQG